MRFFFAENANRMICGRSFEPVEVFGGTIRGLFSTEDNRLADRLAVEPGVREIDGDEFDDRRKKKATTLGDFPRWRMNMPAPRPTPRDQVALADKAGVVAESGATAKKKPKGQPETTDDALKLDKIEPAKE